MEDKKTNETNEELIHTLGPTPQPSVQEGLSTRVTIILLVLSVIFGGIGGVLYKKLLPKTNNTISVNNEISNIKPKQTAGVKGKKNFKDKAEGILRKGGVDGEGNFHLERPGGESQNVYLTSSTVDLTPFINKKVRVQGETFSAEKAGWLMDVGYVEILN